MYSFIFPFELIPKNSRVVLYAAGIVGNHYYHQLKETRYCEVLLWLDKNADEKQTKKPCAIKELSDDAYDYVVIALSDEAQAIEAMQALEGYDVPEKKIIHAIHSYTMPQKVHASPLTIREFLYEQGAAERELIKYFYESEGYLSYFNLFIDEIKQALISRDVDCGLEKLIEVKALDIIRGSALTCEAKIVLLYALAVAGAVSKDLMREFVSLGIEMKANLSLKYWLILDLLNIWFLYPGVEYDEFYIKMEELKRSYARDLCLRWEPPAYNRENNCNICVLMLRVKLDGAPAPDAPLQYMSPILRAVSEKRYKIHIIDICSHYYDSGGGFIRPMNGVNRQAETSREELLQYFPEQMEVYNINNAMMKDRQQDILDLICKINPLLIFDMSAEFSSITYYCSKGYPTIHFPMKKQGHSVSAFSHKHVIMQGSEHVEIHPPLTEEQVLRLPVYRERIEPLRIYRRDEYGLYEDDVVVITVGNRLVYDISNELCEQMCVLLRSKESIKWIIVGCNELPYIKLYHEDLIGKSVIFIEYENDLPGLYGICDVYLNPSRIGGWTTIIWAMQQGLAVVSPWESGTNLLGKENTLPSEADLVPYVLRLSEASALLCREKEKYREITTNWQADKYIEKLVLEMEALADSFEASNNS